ncbi:RES domain-containing protein [Rhizobium leguminosarum bv. viciae]|uniref:RES domain-containing protein n=1 Tax=Rhizobium leguminosarum bv. viciae TaxID=387 RepID=A0A8I2GRU8_RHILV|nr:RES domain-containing protein [Rhizobium leguminosarum]MBY5792939.1 RES family NAD+ phosphorylase [Rhizobium leguminosarum]NKM44259.1 RES domain-containing protein [Rhizobium leguminosarum bv. viciae]
MSQENDFKICHNCVRESFLSNLIETDGNVATCHYCGDYEEPCIDAEELANHVEGAFERHYYRTSDQPDMYESMLLRDKELSYDWDRHGEPVLYAIAEAASISEEIAKDILDILEERHGDFEAAQIGEECEFDSESYYEWKSARDHEFAFEWRRIERSLKSQSRFFNQGAEAFLARLFADLDGHITRDGQPVVVVAGPDTDRKSFFRARVFHKSGELDEAMMRPDLHLGPPPGRFARAGRMNANGISMFYGASDKGVALAEVRPPVGSRALIGEFQLTRLVRLLDVSALHSVYIEGSIFNPNYLDQLGLAKFMTRLSDRITMPVMPDDEPTEYLITQMIADYLARRPAPALDGILFSSVQCPGEHRNVVLFHHASRVEALEMPNETELSAHQYSSTEDGDEPDYWVWETVPPATEPKEEKVSQFGPFDILDVPSFNPDADDRDATLQVLTSSISAHHIKGVTFATDDFEVHRHRIEKRQWKFAGKSPADLPEPDF